MMILPHNFLIDADLFISYLTGDELEPRFNSVVENLSSGAVEAYVSSEVYDDIVSALRSQKVPLEEVMEFISDMRTIPHKPLSLTPEIVVDALQIYAQHGGPRKIHYFDSYHVATAKRHNLPLLTSDKYIIEHAKNLDVRALDIRKATK